MSPTVYRPPPAAICLFSTPDSALASGGAGKRGRQARMPGIAAAQVLAPGSRSSSRSWPGRPSPGPAGSSGRAARRRPPPGRRPGEGVLAEAEDLLEPDGQARRAARLVGQADRVAGRHDDRLGGLAIDQPRLLVREPTPQDRQDGPTTGLFHGPQAGAKAATTASARSLSLNSGRPASGSAERSQSRRASQAAAASSPAHSAPSAAGRRPAPRRLPRVDPDPVGAILAGRGRDNAGSRRPPARAAPSARRRASFVAGGVGEVLDEPVSPDPCWPGGRASAARRRSSVGSIARENSASLTTDDGSSRTPRPPDHDRRLVPRPAPPGDPVGIGGRRRGRTRRTSSSPASSAARRTRRRKSRPGVGRRPGRCRATWAAGGAAAPARHRSGRRVGGRIGPDGRGPQPPRSGRKSRSARIAAKGPPLPEGRPASAAARTRRASRG